MKHQWESVFCLQTASSSLMIKPIISNSSFDNWQTSSWFSLSSANVSLQLGGSKKVEHQSKMTARWSRRKHGCLLWRNVFCEKRGKTCVKNLRDNITCICFACRLNSKICCSLIPCKWIALSQGDFFDTLLGDIFRSNSGRRKSWFPSSLYILRPCSFLCPDNVQSMHNVFITEA